MLKSLMIALALAVSGSATQTEQVHEHGSHTTSIAVEAISATGVVKSIARDENVIRIFHDPIPQLRWPAMNMPFEVSDPAMFDGVAVGDRITYDFTRNGPKNTIVKISR